MPGVKGAEGHREDALAAGHWRAENEESRRGQKRVSWDNRGGAAGYCADAYLCAERRVLAWQVRLEDPKLEEQPTLGQLIWLVRRELEWAHAVDVQRPLRFDVDAVELDVAVEVARITSGEGGLDLKVMGVGFGGMLAGERSTGSTSTVHVVMKPRDVRSPGGKFDVSSLDLEPPPRRPEPTRDDRAGTSSDPNGNDLHAGAEDSEPPPGQ